MKSPFTIGIVGYGKMGKAIESVAEKQGITVAAVIDEEENAGGSAIRSLDRNTVDVLLEFTQPESVLANVQAAVETGLTIVVGTTGWYGKLDAVRSTVEQHGGGLFYASNFSIGMNVMFQLVQKAVRQIDGFPEYDVFVHEIHHNQKKDSPSGSAHTLGEIILRESARKKRMELDRCTDAIDPSALHVTSTRAGSVVGTHTVGFDSDFDAIEIRHTAKNRMGFVQGALRAAQWMKGRTGVYTMEDLLNV
jgi:4-hydroxy-tetrahydrodipicolinate reductase